jgi:CheY-like chemotaxis protein
MKKELNVFYADDDEEDQELFKNIALEIKENLRLVIQKDGIELIKQLQSHPLPDIIFLDLNMPRQNGYDALKEIRNDKKMGNVPVVIFSTSDDDRAINATRQLGASLYVTKPNSFSAFKNIINHTLSLDWALFKTDDLNFVYKAQ